MHGYRPLCTYNVSLNLNKTRIYEFIWNIKINFHVILFIVKIITLNKFKYTEQFTSIEKNYIPAASCSHYGYDFCGEQNKVSLLDYFFYVFHSMESRTDRNDIQFSRRTGGGMLKKTWWLSDAVAHHLVPILYYCEYEFSFDNFFLNFFFRFPFSYIE
jgi:hypothetical protein